MSLKIKLTSSICAFFLVLGLLIMGVFAAPSATINLGGSLTFTATDVNATVTGTVKGTASEVTLPDLNFTNTTDVASEGAKWANKDLAFKDDGSTITILITVTNNAKDRPLYVSVEDAVPSNSNVVDKTMKTLATADATEGTDYDGSTLTIDENGRGTYQAFIQLTLKVKDVNTSLDGASYGYNINLNNKNPEEKIQTVNWHKTNSLIDFNLTTEGETRTAAVKMVSKTVTTGNIIIPSKVKDDDGNVYTVVAISDNAFFDINTFSAAAITSVTFPDSITSIGNSAFRFCSSLTGNINLSNVTSIGNSAFANCGGLTGSIDLSNVTSIGDSAFDNCSGLTGSIDLSNVTSIGDAAFSGCSGLTSVTIGNRLTSIKSLAFNSCSNLSSVIIGSGVTIISSSSFSNCSALIDVYYTGTEEEWGKITIDSNYNEALINATKHYNYGV